MRLIEILSLLQSFIVLLWGENLAMMTTVVEGVFQLVKSVPMALIMIAMGG